MRRDHSGRPKSSYSVSKDSTYLAANDGLLVSAPTTGNCIIIYDLIVTSGSGKLGTSADGAGTQICLIKQGLNQFRTPIKVPAGQALYTDAQSGNITLTYNVVKEPSGTTTNVSSGGGATTTTIQPTTLAFAAATSSIAEGNSGTSVHTVTVNRAGNTSGTATIDYATANVTATSGSDYTAASGTLTFGAGVTSQNVSITITGDTGNEDGETFNITLSNPTQTVGSASITGTNPHVATITNDDTSNISFAAGTSSIAEGASPGTSTHTVTVNRSDTNGTATVDYATSNVTANAGTDYTAASGTLSFANGESSKNISVTITGDGTNENSETFNVTLSNAASQYGSVAITGTNPHVVTITNDDTSNISFAAGTSSVAEGNSGTSTHAITVNRSDTNGTATVDYATSNATATAGSDYTAKSGTLSFGNGVGSMNISITITGDSTVESSETFNVTLSNAASQYGATAITGTNPHVVTITNDDSDGGTSTTTSTTSAGTTTTTSAGTTTTTSSP